jgi:hypothetical protein
VHKHLLYLAVFGRVNERREYPSLTELEQIGLIPDDASADLWDAQNRGELGTAHGGTKVGGWPVWIEQPVALTCPRAHEMRYLLSFDAQQLYVIL